MQCNNCIELERGIKITGLVGILGVTLAFALGKNSEYDTYTKTQVSQVYVGDFNGDGNSNDVKIVQNDGKTSVWNYSPKEIVYSSIYDDSNSFKTNITPRWIPSKLEEQ